MLWFNKNNSFSNITLSNQGSDPVKSVKPPVARLYYDQ